MIVLEKLPSKIDIEAARCKKSLYHFVREFWEVVEPARTKDGQSKFKDNWHIHAICDHLEAVSRGEIDRLIINIPPRHMKSLLVSVFWPAWEWITRPEHRWLFSSYAMTLSTRDSVKTRRLITSPKFLSYFGDIFSLSGDVNQKTRFENDKGGYRLATAVGGALTGEGGDTLVVDDPHNVIEAPSDAVRNTTIEWFNESFRSRLNDPANGAILIIMQRIHEEDLSGHLFALSEKVGDDIEHWDRLVLPARFEVDHPYLSKTTLGFVDPRTEEGELLWPERLPDKKLKSLEAGLGEYAAAGQLQQRPSPAEGGLIKKFWFQWYETLPENPTRWFMSWDCAFKGLDTSDFVACIVGVLHQANLYVVDGYLQRVAFPETVDAIRTMKKKHTKCTAIYVEDKANGPAVISVLRNSIPGMIAVNPGKDSKESRISAGSDSIKSGNVYLPKNHWVSDKIISQAIAFPNGANDDLLDALIQAIIQELGIASLAALYDAI